MQGQKQLFSKSSDMWQTPQKLFAELDARWHFDVDGAADASNHLCSEWFGPGGIHEDALTCSWGPKRTPILTNLTGGTQTVEFPTHVFLNPPYSRVAEFVRKASEESSLNHATTIMLIPARSDTKWFHSYIYDDFTWTTRPHVTICFLKGRLKFFDPNADPAKKRNSAPFPSMLVFFHAHHSTTPIL